MPRQVDNAQLRRWLADGLSQREIAQRMGLPRSTLYGRLKRLQLLPVQRPVQPTDTGAVQCLEALEYEVTGLRLLMQSVLDRLNQAPVSAPVQITALPPYPQGKAVRWNLWILDAIRDEVASLSKARGISPSQLTRLSKKSNFRIFSKKCPLKIKGL
jgi:AraC-like DNA-binding protein